MKVVVVTPPDPIVSLEDAKAHLRVDHSDDDDLIGGLIEAATSHLDGPSGWLGRALGRQTLALSIDHFDCRPLPLPYPPIAEIETVVYVDAAGAEQTLDAAVYSLSSRGLGLAPDQAWPTVRCQPDAVTITYAAGWPMTGGAAPTWTGPAAIRVAILMLVGDLYENREAQVAQAQVQFAQNPTVQALLSPHRVWSV